MPDRPEIVHQVTAQPAYSARLDRITLPHLSQFESAAEYYATLWHELVHSSGSRKRLNRFGEVEGDRFERYSIEELVAEIGAAFLCALTGVANVSTDALQASYINGWAAALRKDVRLVLRAASADHADRTRAEQWRSLHRCWLFTRGCASEGSRSQRLRTKPMKTSITQERRPQSAGGGDRSPRPQPPSHRWRAASFAALIAGTLWFTAGCASHQARKQLEGVAKGWCETIRASQVIPVYPLTEDLTPGDVFLVQTPIASQTKLYRQRGFLALDDRRTRLEGFDYSQVYFDGYWDWGKEFGATPHTPPSRATPGELTGAEGITNVLTDVVAPRAAFPTYTFEAQSSFGLGLAVPVQGIPVALSFLQADRVRGSVTISDARTYAADEQGLYAALRAWAQEDDVQAILAETVRRAGSTPIFLRVVSRVYLAGGVIVSLQRAGSAGAQARGGANPPEVPSLIGEDGQVNAGYTNLLKVLSETAKSPIADIVDKAKAGGTGLNYQRFDAAFARAYDERDKE